MKNIILLILVLLIGFNLCIAQNKYPVYPQITHEKSPSIRLSNQYLPEFGVWVWRPQELEPDGFKKEIDRASEHSPYNFLIPFLRFPSHEVVDSLVYNQVKEAAIYAAGKGILLAPDLDVREARRAFKKKYPDELQQMLRLKEVSLSNKTDIEVTIPSLDLNDHYSGGSITHHISLKGELLRVYAYQKEDGEIMPGSIRDVTGECDVLVESKDSVSVQIKATNSSENYACAMVAFTHLYPDIFAPHLMAFQRSIIEKYGDLPLAGVCKDEWGFPPYYPRFFRLGTHDFWYSGHRADAYAERTGGRELLADCMLMSFTEKGKQAERQMAINQFMEMSRERNTALEVDFYKTVKKVFGPDAAVTVHSTWWPYPDKCEFKKNGLDWWTAKRDWAQTDEVAPFAVRTALAKKWGSPVWYHMYYKEDMATQVWNSVLAGGRIDYLSFQYLYFIDGLMRGESRIRLLNYISKEPLDCRVAVVFGYASATNWASPGFNDVGMQLVDSLWHEGYPTDLIPTYEISNGSLKVGPDGKIWYGKQAYDVVILYHPELETKSIADFFNQVKQEKTTLFRIGDWKHDSNGNLFAGNELLSQSMISAGSITNTFHQVCKVLEQEHVLKQTPATGVLDNTYFKLRDFEHSSCAPPTTGFCRLIDGTVIYAAGTNHASGDTIQVNFNIGSYDVSADAVGVVATRLDEDGKLMALAAGGLKSFQLDYFKIDLEERVDLALWKDENGSWRGVIQGWDGAIPSELESITGNWTRLDVPTPPKINPIK